MLKRFVSVIPVMVVVALVTFLLATLSPGDPAVLLAGQNATNQQIEAVRHQLGLDQSFWHQFFQYLSHLLHGDLGKSLLSGKSVTTIIWQVVPATASIALAAMVFAILVSLILGTWAGIHRDEIGDRFVSGISAFFLGIPPFVVGLVLILVFAITFHLFPATGYVGLGGGVISWLKQITLPGVALGLPLAAEVMRQTRGALVDVLEQDYIRTQRAKGLPEYAVLGKHVFKNALPPVITVVALQIARLLGATIIVEAVFGIGGVGQLTFTAVTQHDFPVIQGIALLSGVVVVATNLVADILAAMISPQLRRSL